MRNYIKAMFDGLRPHQWIKNTFIFVPIPFGGKLFSIKAWEMSIAMFFLFCGLASSIYLINDIKDRKEDMLHALKNKRAIASGRLPVNLAIIESLFLMIISMIFIHCIDSYLKNNSFVLTNYCLIYIVINLLYTFWLKKLPILDVLLISIGFTIRVICGVIAIGVVISPWLLMCTFMLSLFISISKRRSEIIDCTHLYASKIRYVNSYYTKDRIEYMLSVASSMSIMSYSLYCISPETHNRLGSYNMILTIPFVVYGIFHYYCLSGISGYSDTFQILIKDKIIWLIIISWFIAVIIILN